MKEETIYHNECNCLFANDVRDDDCLKRFYEVFDEFGNTKRIAICNEHVRLKIHNELHTLNRDSRSRYAISGRKYITEEVVGGIVSSYVGGGSYKYYKTNSYDLFDIIINVEICDKLSLYKSYNVEDAIKESLNGAYRVKQKLIYELSIYVSNMRYKKYITRYKQLKPLLNKIENEWNKERQELLWNEFLLKVLEIKIKNK